MNATGKGGDFYLNILLWLMGLIPGVIHGYYIILNTPTQQQPVVNNERKYDLAAPSTEPIATHARSSSRDGTEIRPFTSDPDRLEDGMSDRQSQGQGQLPTYDSVAGSWSGQQSPPTVAGSARGDKKGH